MSKLSTFSNISSNETVKSLAEISTIVEDLFVFLANKDSFLDEVDFEQGDFVYYSDSSVEMSYVDGELILEGDDLDKFTIENGYLTETI